MASIARTTLKRAGAAAASLLNQTHGVVAKPGQAPCGPLDLVRGMATRSYNGEDFKYTKGDMSWTPPGRNHLYVPGPVNIPDRLQRAMMRSSENHRDPSFAGFLKPIMEDMKMMYKTETGTTFVYPSTGTGAWEAGLTNTLNPGDKVVCFRYGMFSHLWTEQARRLGLDVHIIDAPWGYGADEAKLQAVLSEDKAKAIKAVMVVHNETSTGVTSDIRGVRAAMDAASHPALLLVDGVSSIGALEFEMDAWRVDVAMTGSQKALCLPTGLGLACASPKALQAMKTSKLPRFFFAWEDMMRTNDAGTFPYTPSIPLLYGLREALQMMKDEGLNNIISRHVRLAEGTRRAVAAWGFKLLCKDPRWNSHSLTVVEAPAGVNTDHLVKLAWAKYNLTIGLGLGDVKGKVFRIGHLGDMNEISMLGAIAGCEMALLDCGAKITPGSGVAAALNYWRETSAIIKSREIL